MMVIDANIVISRWLTQDHYHQATQRWWDEQVRANSTFIAPTLLIPEVTGAIVRRLQRPAAAQRAESFLRTFPLFQYHPLDDALAQKASALAIEHRLRGADSIYVALAQILGVPLVTWDAEVLKQSTPQYPIISPSS
jgi:predicted nucleic acid-binding protein